MIIAPSKKARESVDSADCRCDGAPADYVYLFGLRRKLCLWWGGPPALAEGGGGLLCPPVPLLTRQGRQGEAWLEGSSEDRAGQEQSLSCPRQMPTLEREHLKKKEAQPPRPGRSRISAAQKIPARQLSSEAAAWPRGYQTTF